MLEVDHVAIVANVEEAERIACGILAVRDADKLRRAMRTVRHEIARLEDRDLARVIRTQEIDEHGTSLLAQNRWRKGSHTSLQAGLRFKIQRSVHIQNYTRSHRMCKPSVLGEIPIDK